MLAYFLLYLGGWIFTSTLMACTHKQDPQSYVVWDTEDFVFSGLFWPIFLPLTLVSLAVRYWSGK